MKIKTRNINNCVKRITIEGDKPIHILVDNSQEIKCIEIFGDMNSIVLKRNYFSILNTTDIQNLNDIEINQLYSKRLKELKLITSENTIKAKKDTS